jgi:hypothetical protein
MPDTPATACRTDTYATKPPSCSGHVLRRDCCRRCGRGSRGPNGAIADAFALRVAAESKHVALLDLLPTRLARLRATTAPGSDYRIIHRHCGAACLSRLRGTLVVRTFAQSIAEAPVGGLFTMNGDAGAVGVDLASHIEFFVATNRGGLERPCIASLDHIALLRREALTKATRARTAEVGTIPDRILRFWITGPARNHCGHTRHDERKA